LAQLAQKRLWTLFGDGCAFTKELLLCWVSVGVSQGCPCVAPLRGGFAILDSPRQTVRISDLSAGLSKRVKANEREARALTRLVKPITIASGFCVSGTITKSCPMPLCTAGMRAILSVSDKGYPDFGTPPLLTGQG
jgi:hypothetical protein